MRILHLSAQKPDSTGSGVYLRETVASLGRAGHEQAVIAGIGPGDDPHFACDALFRPVRFETDELPFCVVGMSNVMPYPATRYGDLTPAMTRQFKEAFTTAIDDVLDRFQPNLIICHHLYLLCAVLTHHLAARSHADAGAPTGSRPPIVCGLSHSTDMRQMRQIPLERDFIREGVRLLDRVYALHDAQADEIVAMYGVDPQRVRVVGTGYDASRFFGVPGLRAPEAPHVLYAGKIYRKKGIESLLRAFEQVVEVVPEARLTLAGGYNDEREYDEIVSYARDHEIPATFAGRLDQDALARAYNTADVFVLPSFFEGLPLVVVEALACGCKAVVTDLPGLRPWLLANTNGGLLEFVEPPRLENVDEPVAEDLPAFERRLAEALVKAIDAPAAPCDTSSASWDACAQRLL